ncbi:MAG: GNAT family N-acetyltransferase [Gemmatimonadota bacterium]
MLKFLGVVFVGGAAAGLAGLALGAAAGRLWEHIHRLRRPAQQDEAIVGLPRAAKGTRTPLSIPPEALPPLRFGVGDVDVNAYLALAGLSPRADDLARVSAAVEKTINIGAWNGDRLVGVARILTDGYFFAALSDIVVHSAYRQRGIGRELMNRALGCTPAGVLYIVARDHSAGFFHALGCERGSAGFTMQALAKTTAAG